MKLTRRCAPGDRVMTATLFVRNTETNSRVVGDRRNCRDPEQQMTQCDAPVMTRGRRDG